MKVEMEISITCSTKDIDTILEKINNMKEVKEVMFIHAYKV